jgi:hypothetical protein
MGANIRGIAGRRGGVVATLAIAILASGASLYATPVTIDNFALPNPGTFIVLPTGLNPSLVLTQPAVGALGGQRDTQFQVFGNTVSTAATGNIGHDTSFNIDAFQLGTINGNTFATPTVTTLQYSGANAGNTATTMNNAHNLGGGTGVNLINGTNDRIQISFFTSDALPAVQGLDMAITITSPGGLSSTLTKDAPNSQSPFICDFPFSQFVGNADFTHVDSVRVAFNGARQTPNVDFEIRGIIAVPEPTSLITMTLGGVLCCAARLFNRKRRQSV